MFAAILSLFIASFTGLMAQSPPPPIPFRLQQNFLTGFSSPVLLTTAKDGTGRLFIVEQGGIIRVVQPGSTTATEFMNITGRVLSGGERGLLGLTFHPNFENNHYFFVNYTRQTDGATMVSRFTANASNTIGDPNSERNLLNIPQPFANHNGGMIEFGPDGHLYIGMGDGGSANDPGNRAQNINDLLGKFLRITPDVSGSPTAPAYTNPPDNPYVGVAGADEIYAIGLRNPWRWSFDRLNGQLWAGDVGQGAWEEVSIITRGGNFGWRVYEGNACTNLDPSLCVPANFIPPVFQYANAASPRCSVTGGYVYRGQRNALPYGSYVYADYCTGEILLWYNNQQILLVDSANFLVSFGEDEEGELYVVRAGGTIDKITRGRVSADFDNDARTDISVFRSSNGTWYVRNSSNGSVPVTPFGISGDIPITEDFDGDNAADIGVFRQSNGFWYYIRSSNSTFTAVPFGTGGDRPAAGDYDGDTRADLTVFRPSNGVWYTLRSLDSAVTAIQFGLGTDTPTPGDYDGDGRYDIAVWRDSNGVWYRINSLTGTFSATQFGTSGDLPAQGDFDGDGRIDQTVFRPSNGAWYTLRSSNGSFQATLWGSNGDVPVAGNYDSDGRDDLAVFRPSNGVWYTLRSTDGTFQATPFGLMNDLPIPFYDKP